MNHFPPSSHPARVVDVSLVSTPGPVRRSVLPGPHRPSCCGTSAGQVFRLNCHCHPRGRISRCCFYRAVMPSPPRLPMPLPLQDEALDSEGPRLAFEEMAKHVNALAAAAAARAGPGAPPPPVKTADDVGVTLAKLHLNGRGRGEGGGVMENCVILVRWIGVVVCATAAWLWHETTILRVKMHLAPPNANACPSPRMCSNFRGGEGVDPFCVCRPLKKC